MSSIILQDLNFIERALAEPDQLNGGMMIPILELPMPLNLNLGNIPTISSLDSSNNGENNSSATAQISGDKGGTAETFTFTTSNHS